MKMTEREIEELRGEISGTLDQLRVAFLALHEHRAKHCASPMCADLRQLTDEANALKIKLIYGVERFTSP